MAGRSGDRIPVGARFSALVQTGCGDQPASKTMCTVSLLGVKRSERGMALTTEPPSTAKVKERIELYLYSPCGPSWPILW